MNNITIAGPIGRDAEVRNTGTDSVASFSVADSQGRDKPTIWWRCNLWGKRAASLAPYLLKGQQVAVSGTVSEREWTDKDGTPRKSIEIRVADVALQGGKRDSEAPAPARKPAAAAPAGGGFDDMDDVPF